MNTSWLGCVAALCLSAAEVRPIELGRVPWLRDYDAAIKQAKDSGKPILVLFQEVPG